MVKAGGVRLRHSMPHATRPLQSGCSTSSTILRHRRRSRRTRVQSTDVQVVQMIDPTGGKASGDPPRPSATPPATRASSSTARAAEGVPQPGLRRHDELDDLRQQCVELAKMITGLGGDQPIPGSTLASDRFARASYYVSRLERPKTELQAVAGMFSVIRNAAQPFRAGSWQARSFTNPRQTVSDLTNKRYVRLDHPSERGVGRTRPASTTPNTNDNSTEDHPVLTQAVPNPARHPQGQMAFNNRRRRQRQVRRQGELQLPHPGHGEAAV